MALIASYFITCRVCYIRFPCINACQVSATDRGYCYDCYTKLSSAPVGTGNAQSSGVGEASFPVAIAAEWIEKPLCSNPACAARGVVATESGMCAYCWHSTDGDTGCDRGYLDGITALTMLDRAEQVEARARLARWDAAEQPRVTATSKLLAMGHPSSWPEIGEDEP